MQTSLRSGYDLIGDICLDHINICADHCRSLVHAHRNHGSSIRCPAFGSYSKTVCHSRATDSPVTTIPIEERRQLNWSHCQQKRQIIIRTDKKDRIVIRIVWNILCRIDLTQWERMDGIYFLGGAPLILRGHHPCQNLKLTFNEPLWVASPAHSHCSSGNNPNLVRYGSGKAGYSVN